MNRQSLIVDQLKTVNEIRQFFENLDELEAKLNTAPELAETFDNNKVHAAIYDDRWMLCLNLKTSGKQTEVLELLKSAFGAKETQAGQFSLEFKQMKNLQMKIEEGIIVVSDSPQLLTEALDATAPKLHTNPEFKKYKSLLEGEQTLSLFVNHKKYAASRYRKKINLAYITGSGTSCANLSNNPAELSMNGILTIDSTEKLNFVKGEEPLSTLNLIKELPVNTSFIEAFSCAKKQNLLQAFLENKSNAKFWERANEKAMYSVKEDFYNNMNGSLVYFESQSRTSFARISIRDTIKTKEQLAAMSDTIVRRDSVSLYKLNAADEPALFAPLSDLKTGAAMSFGPYVYFASEIQHLEYLLSFLRTGALLHNEEKFVQYVSEQVPENCQYFLYASPSLSQEKMNRFFNFQSTDTAFKNLKHLSYTAEEQNGEFRFRFQVTHETSSPYKQNLWFTDLDTVSNKQPMGFVNHNTGEKEMLVQDDANQLYLVNAKGQILWRKKLKEPLTSGLFMVDVLKNKKYQMLFSTKTEIHLLDRNGKYLDGFPLKLPAPAANGLSVFDYENNQDYRMLIACTNNMIYNYSVNGRLTEGFKPLRTTSRVTLPVQFAAIGGAQYLVAIDEGGKIYAFSRKGVEKVTFRNRSTASCQSFFVDVSRTIDKSYIVYVDEKNNLLNKISFADKKEIVELNEQGTPASIRFQRVDENVNTDVLTAADASIKGFDFSGQELLSEHLEEPVSAAEVVRDENINLLCAMNSARNFLYIRNLTTGMQDKIEGNTLPLVLDLFGKNKKYLVYISGSRLSCRDIQ